jgi:hypothetical protein
MHKTRYSKILCKFYVWDDNPPLHGKSIRFCDGVEYTMAEAIALGSASPGDLVELHRLKQMLDCTIIKREV